MSVIQKSNAELFRTVREVYPDFHPEDLNTDGHPWVKPTGSPHFVWFLSCRKVDRLPHCCGVIEIGGLEPLCGLKGADLALFELWLRNNCGLPFQPACYVATTANVWNATAPTEIEWALYNSGWTPLNRGVNTIHGNHVITWTYKVSPDSMYKQFGGEGKIFPLKGLTLDEKLASQKDRYVTR